MTVNIDSERILKIVGKLLNFLAAGNLFSDGSGTLLCNLVPSMPIIILSVFRQLSLDWVLLMSSIYFFHNLVFKSCSYIGLISDF